MKFPATGVFALCLLLLFGLVAGVAPNDGGSFGSSSDNADADGDGVSVMDTTMVEEASFVGSVRLKRLWKFREREMSLSRSTLTACKVDKEGKATGKCEALDLKKWSEVLEVKGKRGDQFRFSVTGRPARRAFWTAGKWKSTDRWIVDAGSQTARQEWMAAIRQTVDAPWGSPEVSENIRRSDEVGSHEMLWWGGGEHYGPAFRGSTLSADDPPMLSGQYLSNSLPPHSANDQDGPAKEVMLYLDAQGTLTLRSGGMQPDSWSATRHENIIWTHELDCDCDRIDDWPGAPVQSGGRADEGAGCEFLLKVVNGVVTYHGGSSCRSSASRAPRRSWRESLPWSPKRAEIRNSRLHLAADGEVVIVSPSGEVLKNVRRLHEYPFVVPRDMVFWWRPL